MAALEAPKRPGAGRLMLAGLALPVVVAALVPLFTAWWPGGLRGYFVVLGLYWALYCVPVAIWSGAFARGLSFKLNGAVWVPVVVLAQAVSFVVYGLLNGLAEVPLMALALGALAAAVNAPLEEFAWRGAYLSVAPRNPLVQGLGVWIFGLWHVPLMLASGVVFSEDRLVIILGALMLGMLWGTTTFWSRTIGWPVVGHFITNVVAFAGLIAANAAPF